LNNVLAGCQFNKVKAASGVEAARLRVIEKQLRQALDWRSQQDLALAAGVAKLQYQSSIPAA
jgi:hypothetical protein